MAVLRVAALLALVAAASAFQAPAMSGLRLRSNKSAMTMTADAPKFAGIKKALAPAIAAASIAAPAFAEGTGEALGVDDGRLLVPLVLIPVFIAILFSNFASTQDNEDFFDTYDQRRK